ncbi:hypothetical protein LINGRAHAP2_LOCUS29534 [Linum grandiflorum]
MHNKSSGRTTPLNLASEQQKRGMVLLLGERRDLWTKK